MDLLRISLFGRLRLSYGDAPVTTCSSAKAQELLCYLLLHRDRPHPRETLASLLWGGHCTTAQSKKYLRKALWQLQAGLSAYPGLEEYTLLETDPEWIQLNATGALWLDVAVFEEAYAVVQDVPGHQLGAWDAGELQRGTEVYAADLLEGWYQDWCLCERERLQQMYLIMLDKLMEHCEQTGTYETGLLFGETSLRHDRARERTYQQLMRLHYALSDRTGALRQYTRCVEALREELDVAPSARTQALYERIRQDDGSMETLNAAPPRTDTPASVSDRLDHIITLQHKMAALQTQIQREIEAVEFALQRRTA